VLQFVPLIFWALPKICGSYMRHDCDMIEGAKRTSGLPKANKIPDSTGTFVAGEALSG
jgi:hypothetical protein